MAAFDANLAALIGQIDRHKHPREVERLRACRGLPDLDRIVSDGGWLLADTAEPRLKLIKHGSGTWLVVQYVDGWSTRLGMQPFGR